MLLTTEARGLGALPQMVRELRGDEWLSRIVERSGLPEAVTYAPDARVPLKCVADLFEHAAGITDDPLFGLRVGKAMTPGDFGMWVRYSLVAPSLDRALRRLVQSCAYYQGRHSIHVRRRGNIVTFAYCSGLPRDISQTHHADHTLPPMLALFAGYAGKDAQPRALLVPHDSAGHRALIEQSLGFPVIHSPGMTGLAFDAARLSDRHSQNVPDGFQPTFADLRAMVRARPPKRFLDLVLAMVHTQLLAGQVSLERTAQMIAIGPRTLQRRLMLEGHSFRELVEHARCDRAVGMLAGSSVPIAEIGTALGYENASHFTRAFRRWTNTTPQDYRSGRLIA